MGNMTYDDGLITFDCGTQMKAPPQIQHHFDGSSQSLVVIVWKSGEAMYYSRDAALESILECGTDAIEYIMEASMGDTVYA